MQWSSAGRRPSFEVEMQERKTSRITCAIKPVLVFCEELLFSLISFLFPFFFGWCKAFKAKLPEKVETVNEWMHREEESRRKRMCTVTFHSLNLISLLQFAGQRICIHIKNKNTAPALQTVQLTPNLYEFVFFFYFGSECTGTGRMHTAHCTRLVILNYIAYSCYKSLIKLCALVLLQIFRMREN